MLLVEPASTIDSGGVIGDVERHSEDEFAFWGAVRDVGTLLECPQSVRDTFEVGNVVVGPVGRRNRNGKPGTDICDVVQDGPPCVLVALRRRDVGQPAHGNVRAQKRGG